MTYKIEEFEITGNEIEVSYYYPSDSEDIPCVTKKFEVSDRTVLSIFKGTDERSEWLSDYRQGIIMYSLKQYATENEIEMLMNLYLFKKR